MERHLRHASAAGRFQVRRRRAIGNPACGACTQNRCLHLALVLAAALGRWTESNRYRPVRCGYAGLLRILDSADLLPGSSLEQERRGFTHACLHTSDLVGQHCADRRIMAVRVGLAALRECARVPQYPDLSSVWHGRNTVRAECQALSPELDNPLRDR